MILFASLYFGFFRVFFICFSKQKLLQFNFLSFVIVLFSSCQCHDKVANLLTYITKIRQTNSKNAYFVMICTCVYYVQLFLAKQESPISATLLKVCKTLHNFIQYRLKGHMLMKQHEKNKRYYFYQQVSVNTLLEKSMDKKICFGFK